MEGNAIHIKAFPSRIKVYPYHKGDSPTLEKRLSIYDYRNHEYGMTLYFVDIKNECIWVPRGYSITETVKALEADDYYEIMNDGEGKPIPGRNVSINMRPGIAAKDEHQINSVTFLVEDSPESYQKFLNIDTGYGKTFCDIKAISLLSYPAMIILSKSGLIEQWKKCFKTYTYCKDEDIFIVQGRDSMRRAINEARSGKGAKVYLCATQTCAIAAEEGELQEFTEACDIGVKTIDEAHEMMKATTTIDLGCDVMYNFYLTATPERSKSVEDLMYNKITKTFKRFGAYTGDLMKYTHVKNVHINTRPSPWHQRIARTRNGFSGVIYEKYIFKNDRKTVFFYLIIKYIALQLLERDPEAKILVIFSMTDSINKISDLFWKNDKISCGKYISGNGSDKTSKEKKEKALRKSIILSTIKSSGAGLDIPNLRTIINFVPFKSPVLLHQLFGRLRYIPGKALFYFNIVDDGYEDIVRQNFHRQRFFKQKSRDIKELSLNMEMLLNKFYIRRNDHYE
ncbi:MAG: DEAD/DEAH box helicase family protein [Bacilli bacterium]|nr:DEAD/DEAH box helicase family protein [Bacilli bacterium]